MPFNPGLFLFLLEAAGFTSLERTMDEVVELRAVSCLNAATPLVKRC